MKIESYFKTQILGLGISITPKVHIIFEHVPQYCSRFGRGLGLTSEQAGESVHSLFKRSFQKLKVNDVSSPRWATNVLKTVLDFNALSCVK